MPDGPWRQYLDRIEAAGSFDALPKRLADFLFFQKALHRMGRISEERLTALESIGFSFAYGERLDEDKEWDRNISALLEYKAQHSTQKVPHSSIMPRFKVCSVVE